MENPCAQYPVPVLADQPLDPMGPPASSQVASSPCTLSRSSHSSSSESFMHKNRLQEFTQRSSMPLPIYQTFNEGLGHAPKFRSTVLVDGVTYISESTFSNIKAAEQDVAKHALECILKKIKDEGCPLIHVDTIFCKSILNEFVVKIKLELPTYTTVQLEGLPPIFVSTLVFNGETYKGETGRSKKEAEQLAARAVIQSLLADDRYGITVSEIIRSKAKLHNAWNKNVETTTITDCVPTSASLHPSTGAKHPRYEFKTPPSGEGTHCIDLPIAFVPAVSGEALDAGENSSRKRRKKNKKAKSNADTKNKKAKLNTDTQLAVSGVPFNQTTPCSLAL
ncbi:hypothetical protein V6N13_079930 [Hibiscus sabdariffa]|uniref:DRBM domain-containing protein n=1 Tax=Hibiscus sabdariffa TaxID=183260 RepID=A0ABR2RT37_9ROSI